MRRLLIFTFVAGAMIAIGTSIAAFAHRSRTVALETPPGEPIAAGDLLYARPFTLDQGYAYEWRAEQPRVSAGWLLVIETDPALCIPSNEYERVLYVGDQTAERINTGRESGRIVAVVPSLRAPNGELAADLAKSPIFWGAPRLPEQVDAAVVEAELSNARRSGIEAFAEHHIDAARAAGGALIAFGERDELIRHCAALIMEFAPPETEFARGLLAPRVR